MDPLDAIIAEELLEGEPMWLLPIKRSLNSLHRKVDGMAVDISGLQAAVAELATEDAALETAVTGAANELGALATQVSSLEAQVAAGGTATITQAEVDVLKAGVEGVGTHLGAAATSLTAATTSAETAATPPASPPATPPASPPSESVSLPLYTHVGSEPIGAEWTRADVDTATGEPLYTFSGDQAGGQPTGASAEWVVYAGATEPIPGQSPAASTPAPDATGSTTPAQSPPGPDPSAASASSEAFPGDVPAGGTPAS